MANPYSAGTLTLPEAPSCAWRTSDVAFIQSLIQQHSTTSRRNSGFIGYNSRYLILPWVRIPHLASHILGRMAAMVPRVWERISGHPVYYLETFIDPELWRGTC